jgi:hypothetical protein
VAGPCALKLALVLRSSKAAGAPGQVGGEGMSNRTAQAILVLAVPSLASWPSSWTGGAGGSRRELEVPCARLEALPAW